MEGVKLLTGTTEGVNSPPVARGFGEFINTDMRLDKGYNAFCKGHERFTLLTIYSQ